MRSLVLLLFLVGTTQGQQFLDFTISEKDIEKSEATVEFKVEPILHSKATIGETSDSLTSEATDFEFGQFELTPEKSSPPCKCGPDCECETCTCGPTTASVSPPKEGSGGISDSLTSEAAFVTAQYRTEVRRVQVCDNGVCRMVNRTFRVPIQKSAPIQKSMHMDHHSMSDEPRRPLLKIFFRPFQRARQRMRSGNGFFKRLFCPSCN